MIQTHFVLVTACMFGTNTTYNVSGNNDDTLHDSRMPPEWVQRQLSDREWCFNILPTLPLILEDPNRMEESTIF